MNKQQITKAGLLHIKEGKLLIVYKGKLGMYITPGGKIEPYETDEECLKREILEEICCKVKNFSHFGTFRSDSLEQRCYLGELNGTITLNPNDSINGYCWIGRDYKELGITLAPMLEHQIIPELIARGLF